MNRDRWSPYRQSGVIPFRFVKKKLQVLLITSRRRGNWIVPKGVIEPDMSPAESAAVEAWEEAGVEGSIVGSAIGSYSVKKWHGVCRIELYLLEVTSVSRSWPEQYQRKRSWMTLDEAIDSVEQKPLRELLRKIEDVVGI